MFKSILVTGLGGQGVLTFTNLLAALAEESGLKVSLFHSKGMAQRGGRVTSELRLASDPDFHFGARISPDGADILVGMEIGETLNSYAYLKDGGTLILLDQRIVPAGVAIRKGEYPSFEEVREVFAAKTSRIVEARQPASPHNVFLLGVFGAVAGGPRTGGTGGDLAWAACPALERAVRARLTRGLEENLEALRLGCALGRREAPVS